LSFHLTNEAPSLLAEVARLQPPRRGLFLLLETRRSKSADGSRCRWNLDVEEMFMWLWTSERRTGRSKTARLGETYGGSQEHGAGSDGFDNGRETGTDRTACAHCPDLRPCLGFCRMGRRRMVGRSHRRPARADGDATCRRQPAGSADRLLNSRRRYGTDRQDSSREWWKRQSESGERTVREHGDEALTVFR